MTETELPDCQVCGRRHEGVDHTPPESEQAPAEPAPKAKGRRVG